MRTLWKCAREAILIFLAVGLMNWHAHPAFAEQKSLTDDVRGILLQGAHVGDPSKADQLRACAQNSEYSMQSIENVLVTFLSPELRDVSIKEDRMSYLLRASAISVLGDLRCGNALPYLRKTCEATTDDNMRHQALIAVLRTDTKGFMPFAREIFCDRRRYCSTFSLCRGGCRAPGPSRRRRSSGRMSHPRPPRASVHEKCCICGHHNGREHEATGQDPLHSRRALQDKS